MKFIKMHGAGNDFVFFDVRGDRRSEELLQYPAMATWICDRHFGIGADGLIMIADSTTADLKMRIINSDGTEPEMCGNAIRCFARYAWEEGIVRRDTLRVETLAGIILPHLNIADGKVLSVSVDMGMPRLTRGEIPMTGPASDQAVAFELSAGGTNWRATAVSMGNPHCVIFVDDLDVIDVERIGPLIETHPFFPRKTNVEFAEIEDQGRIRMRVWERGAGITLACGTGACATLTAANLNSLCGRQADVILPGGTLGIFWNDNNHLIMTGPAETVFAGEIELSGRIL